MSSSGDVEDRPEGEFTLDKMVADSLPAEEEPNPHVLQSSQNHGQGVSCRTQDGSAGKDVQDEVTQKMDEDWRLSDSAITEDTDSLEARWASTASLTAASEDAVDMVDTDLAEEMDAEGCDAGEALADTDGVSMGDVSVGSVDEAGAGDPSDGQHARKKLQVKEEEEEETGDYTVEDLSVSLTEDPSVLIRDGEDKTDTNVSGCGDTRSKAAFSHETGRRRNLHNVSFQDFSSLKLQKTRNKKETAVWTREGTREDGGGWCENYVEIFKNNCDHGVAPHQTFEAVAPQGGSPPLNFQPRVRLVSISVPVDVDADVSLKSSRSESTLLFPNDSDLSDLEARVVPFLDDTTDTEQDIGEDHIYEDTGHVSEGEGLFPFEKRTAASPSWSLTRRLQRDASELQLGQRRFFSGLEHPSMSSSPMLGPKQKNYAKPLYLSRYPRSMSLEGQETSAGIYSYMEGSPKQGGAVCFSGSFSPSSSALSTPSSVVDIPPPFELAYITKRPITKSSPSLLVEEDASEKTRKKKSSIKHFLMLKFRRKTDGKSAGPSSFKSSSESIQHASRQTSRCASPGLSQAPPSTFLLHEHSKGRGSAVAFLNRSIVRVESFEERSRAPFVPLPLTKPRSISFPNTDTSDYENVPPISSDYENVQVPQRRPARQVPLPQFFGCPARVLTSASETDGYVDMSSLPGFKGRTQPPDQETERCVNTQDSHNHH